MGSYARKPDMPSVVNDPRSDGAAPALQEACLRQASDQVRGWAIRRAFERSNREEETSSRKTDRCRKMYRLPNESDGLPR